MYTNELFRYCKYSVFHTLITKRIKEGKEEEREGGRIGQYKASNYLSGIYIKVIAP